MTRIEIACTRRPLAHFSFTKSGVARGWGAEGAAAPSLKYEENV